MITKQNKKGSALAGVLITLGVLILIAIIFGSWMVGSYNTLVNKMAVGL